MHIDPAGHSPRDARALFRDGLRTPTAGWCTGRTQANLIAVPRDYAYNVLLFSQRNPKAAPGHMALTDTRDTDLIAP